MGDADAEDNPPSACSVDLNRDCGAGGCIVSAIANYVSIGMGGLYTTAEHAEQTQAKHISNIRRNESTTGGTLSRIERSLWNS